MLEYIGVNRVHIIALSKCSNDLFSTTPAGKQPIRQVNT